MAPIFHGSSSSTCGDVVNFIEFLFRHAFRLLGSLVWEQRAFCLFHKYDEVAWKVVGCTGGISTLEQLILPLHGVMPWRVPVSDISLPARHKQSRIRFFGWYKELPAEFRAVSFTRDSYVDPQDRADRGPV